MIQDEKWTAPPTFTVLPICYNCTSMPAIIFTTGWQNLLHILLIRVSEVVQSPHSLRQHHWLSKHAPCPEREWPLHNGPHISQWVHFPTGAWRAPHLGCQWLLLLCGLEALKSGTLSHSLPCCFKAQGSETCYIWTAYRTTLHQWVASM